MQFAILYVGSVYHTLRIDRVPDAPHKRERLASSILREHPEAWGLDLPWGSIHERFLPWTVHWPKGRCFVAASTPKKALGVAVERFGISPARSRVRRRPAAPA